MRVGHATATQGLSGRVRIAATNALAEEVLAPRLAQLLLSNPGLVIDLLTSTHTVNFSRWRRTWPSSCESRAWRLCHRAAGIDPALPFRARRFPEQDDTRETRYLQRKGLQPQTRCVTASGRVIRTMIQCRQAIRILPDYLCRDM